jgi:hypothetical protein
MIARTHRNDSFEKIAPLSTTALSAGAQRHVDSYNELLDQLVAVPFPTLPFNASVQLDAQGTKVVEGFKLPRGAAAAWATDCSAGLVAPGGVLAGPLASCLGLTTQSAADHATSQLCQAKLFPTGDIEVAHDGGKVHYSRTSDGALTEASTERSRPGVLRTIQVRLDGAFSQVSEWRSTSGHDRSSSFGNKSLVVGADGSFVAKRNGQSDYQNTFHHGREDLTVQVDGAFLHETSTTRSNRGNTDSTQTVRHGKMDGSYRQTRESHWRQSTCSTNSQTHSEVVSHDGKLVDRNDLDFPAQPLPLVGDAQARRLLTAYNDKLCRVKASSVGTRSESRGYHSTSTTTVRAGNKVVEWSEERGHGHTLLEPNGTITESWTPVSEGWNEQSTEIRYMRGDDGSLTQVSGRRCLLVLADGTVEERSL